VFHELATNSAKYGALSVAQGKVAITIRRADDCANITWVETGGPPAVPPDSKGFGSRLMTMVVTNQLQGRMEQDWLPDGLQAEIAIPLAELEK
jgi:two-component sensor histidine kinase